MKVAVLLDLLRRVTYNQCVIFCNYQDKWERIGLIGGGVKWVLAGGRAEAVARRLIEAGEKAQFISAQLEQEKRADVIDLLKRNKCRILVSTDLVCPPPFPPIFVMLHWAASLRRREASTSPTSTSSSTWKPPGTQRPIFTASVGQADLVIRASRRLRC